VLAFEYPTLTQHPTLAARELIERLPRGVRLHLLSHGSGCLVAEHLAWLLATQGAGALTTEAKWLSTRQLELERVTRVAGPVRGYAGAADVALSMQVQLLDRHRGKGDDKLRRQRSELLIAAAKDRAAAKGLPGLAAMDPQDPFIRDINQGTRAAPGQLRVVSASRSGGEGVDAIGRLSALLVDALYFGESDLLVPTRSTFGGVPRAGGSSFFLHTAEDVSHYGLFSHEVTRRAILDAVLLDHDPSGFAPIGPLSAAGQSSDGRR